MDQLLEKLKSVEVIKKLSDLKDKGQQVIDDAVEFIEQYLPDTLTPAIKLVIDGTELGAGSKGRLLSLSLTDKRGFAADDLTIDLSDHDGMLGMPELKQVIEVWLGYKETEPVYKGKFKISEISHGGQPDVVSITARSANLAESLDEQNEKSWRNTTVYDIATAIASKHGYKPAVHDGYKADKIPHMDQTSESDASFLGRLAETVDATASIKNDALIFTPIGEGRTPSGRFIPTAIITRKSGDGHRFTMSDTENYQAVRAYYIKEGTGRRAEVVIDKSNAVGPKKPPAGAAPVKKKKRRRAKKGQAPVKKPKEQLKKINTEGLKVKSMRHLYASEDNAIRGARNAFRKLKRSVATFDINLGKGWPDLIPDMPVQVDGFKDVIDEQDWLISEITHTVNDSGFLSILKLEMLVDFENEDE